MRFAALVILGFLFALPAMAQTKSSNDVGHNYGGATCPQPIPCPSDSGSMSSNELAAAANSCVTRYLGIGNPNGFFDEDLGLDSSNCLTPKPDAIPKMASTKTAPHCCVIQT